MDSTTSSLWDDIVPHLDSARCHRCADCPPVAACPVRAVRRAAPDSVPVADEGYCFGCYACVEACPYSAIIRPRAG